MTVTINFVLVEPSIARLSVNGPVALIDDFDNSLSLGHQSRVPLASTLNLCTEINDRDTTSYHSALTLD